MIDHPQPANIRSLRYYSKKFNNRMGPNTVRHRGLHGDNELQTSVYLSNLAPTRVSKDLQLSIFRCPKTFSEILLASEITFSSFSADLRGAGRVLTSKSDSSTFFALDGQIFSSVQHLKPILWIFHRSYMGHWLKIYGRTCNRS